MVKAKLHTAAFLLTSCLGISLLVFLNAAQAFVLTQILGVDPSRAGKISGSLVFAEELAVLPCVLVWGRIADYRGSRFFSNGPRGVVVAANLLAAVALVLFVQARNVYPQLLLARLLFALGSSGITAMLPALLAILASTGGEEASGNDARSSIADDRPVSPVTASSAVSVDSEQQPLLGWRRTPPEGQKQDARATRLSALLSSRPLPSKRSADPGTRLSAYLGVASGLGALLAVFLYLRLPPFLGFAGAGSTVEGGTATGLKRTFYLVACVACVNAAIAYLGLPSTQRVLERPGEAQAADRKASMNVVFREMANLMRGFRLATKNKQVALGYASGFIARAQVITTTVFIPLYVAAFYQQEGLCKPNSGSDLKTGCHAAYTLASAITGVIQLTALLFAPFLSFTSRPERTLLPTLLIGLTSFVIFGRSAILGPGPEVSSPPNSLVVLRSSPSARIPDLHSYWTWIAAVGVGIAQIGAVVLSLSLIAKGRQQLLLTADEPKGESANENEDAANFAESGQAEDTDCETTADGITEPNGWLEEGKSEIAGALAGAYSFCGGLGILFMSAMGGSLADKHAGAPFLVMAGLDALVIVLAVGFRRTRAWDAP